MTLKLRLATLIATGLIAACAPAVSERPCPRVTEFPKPVQLQAAEEIDGKPAITRMMDSMAADRAFNRMICP
jgi:hypothetical protein